MGQESSLQSAIGLRPGIAADHVAMADLFTRMTPSDRRPEFLAQLDDGTTRAVVAETASGEVSGAAMLALTPNYRGAATVALAVAESARGRGVGTALGEAVLRDIRATSPPLITVILRDDQANGRRFAAGYGLTPTQHYRGWRLPLADPERLLAVLTERAERAGVTVTQAPLDADRAGAAALVREAVVGTPSDTPTNTDRLISGMPGDTVTVVASDPSGPVGCSLIRAAGSGGIWHTSFTGVVPAARGRGVATALNAATFVAAHAHGGTAIMAQNDTRNSAMLSINAAAGMHSDVGYWVYAFSAADLSR